MINACAPTATHSKVTTLGVLFFAFVFSALEIPLFPSLCTINYRFLYVWRVRRTFSFRMVFFYGVATG